MMRAFQGLEGLVKEGRAAMAEQRSRQEQVQSVTVALCCGTDCAHVSRARRCLSETALLHFRNRKRNMRCRIAALELFKMSKVECFSSSACYRLLLLIASCHVLYNWGGFPAHGVGSPPNRVVKHTSRVQRERSRRRQLGGSPQPQLPHPKVQACRLAVAFMGVSSLLR